jgi:hypothetical protein
MGLEVFDGYPRGVNTRTFRIFTNGREQKVDVADVLKALSVDEAMRIKDEDYPEKACVGDTLTNFNLPIQFNRNGFTLAMPRILKPGYFIPPNSEELPLLSFDNIWRAKVVQFFPRLEFKDIRCELLINCIGGATNPDALKLMIYERYKRSLPNLSYDEVLNQGVTVTKLKLIDKVSL